ncbi:MAG: hypothetical protein M0T78_10230 [Actinomycetota bacterium]|nr:hypothetical protein [Actinomycetota bacterium]
MFPGRVIHLDDSAYWSILQTIRIHSPVPMADTSVSVVITNYGAISIYDGDVISLGG